MRRQDRVDITLRGRRIILSHDQTIPSYESQH
jgi:hypothetical protein